MTDLDASPPPSLRYGGDSWIITELVGATALGVAASRAAETAGSNPLIRDEFARVLVSSAGPAWARLADPELPDRSDAAAWLADHGWQVHSVNNYEEMARLGRPVPDDLADQAVSSTLLRALLGGPST